MNSLNIRTILFDLDGTLVDSAPDLASSINQALLTIDKPPVSHDRIRSFIGNGADRLIHRAITDDFNGVAENESYEQVRNAFFELYANGICVDSRLYPTVAETLHDLHQKNYHIACITNKPGRFTEPLLAALGINNYFGLVLSGDSLEYKKPHSVQLEYAAQHLNTPIDQCLMVGDTSTDICAAQNCGMPSVFVTYGYGDVSDLNDDFKGPSIDALADVIQHI